MRAIPGTHPFGAHSCASNFSPGEIVASAPQGLGAGRRQAKMAALSALRFPTPLESRGRPSMADPLGGRKVHWTFLILPPRPYAAGTSD